MLFQEACAGGCTRLDFHVYKWNDARVFYEKKGAVNMTEQEDCLLYRLAGFALEESANQVE